MAALAWTPVARLGSPLTTFPSIVTSSSARCPVAVAKGERHHARHDRLGDHHLADHGLLCAVLEIPDALGVRSRDHLHLVAVLDPELLGIAAYA